MSQIQNDALLLDVSETIQKAADLTELLLSTSGEHDIQDAVDRLSVNVEADNLEDVYMFDLPSLKMKIEYYNNQLADESRESFYGIGDIA